MPLRSHDQILRSRAMRQDETYRECPSCQARWTVWTVYSGLSDLMGPVLVASFSIAIFGKGSDFWPFKKKWNTRNVSGKHRSMTCFPPISHRFDVLPWNLGWGSHCRRAYWAVGPEGGNVPWRAPNAARPKWSAMGPGFWWVQGVSNSTDFFFTFGQPILILASLLLLLFLLLFLFS